MKTPSPVELARFGVRGGAAIVVICTIVLLSADIAERIATPRQDRRIAALQRQAAEDATHAKVLEDYHAGVTKWRRLRKRTGEVSAWLLIIGAAAFLGGSKWRLAQRGPRPAPATLITRIQPAAEMPASPLTAVAVPSSVPAIDLRFVDEVVAREGRGAEAAILILQAIQTHCRYLPDEALRHVCEITEITPAQIAGASTFYAQLRRSPVGRHIVKVCHGTACHVSGARQITDELRRRLRIPAGSDTDADRMFTIDEVACLGCCSLAPVLMVDEHTAGKLTPATAADAIEQVARKELV